jgi:hypothetical protein
LIEIYPEETETTAAQPFIGLIFQLPKNKPQHTVTIASSCMRNTEKPKNEH